jgi:O-acetyl-ADP-ribose deacetylase (regulator of RNase III)
MPIDLLQADITSLDVDAIVNAANRALAGGGGVDGAIHRAAGPALSAACKAIPMVQPFVRCPTGEARITPGFDLPARWIIHAVGPVWSGGREGEPELLASCYRNALALAQAHGIASIAFPAISCGVFGYPPDQAVDIAVRTVRAHAPGSMRVAFCVFDAAMAGRYRSALE